ncbi:hypothetical protein [Flaviflexus huanghaiensis]|uniref:hypothetical protein n=1 Tax=Flaviflexus huanghaiensis TaxID=1111473 RepID=UPI0015FD2E7A|nr:hypothetical protein [Flaviflexus huanghaiensis]
MTDYQPPEADPFDLGPVEPPRDATQPAPMDTFLDRLYGPTDEPMPLIRTEPREQGSRPFPPAMWLWVTGTLTLAIITILLLLS